MHTAPCACTYEAAMSTNIHTHACNCLVNHTLHIILSHQEDTHACLHIFLWILLIPLLLSLGSLRSAYAPSPQTGEWRIQQRWSWHLDSYLAAVGEGLCSSWTPWLQVGADAQNTTLLFYIQSTEQSERSSLLPETFLFHTTTFFFLQKMTLKLSLWFMGNEPYASAIH